MLTIGNISDTGDPKFLSTMVNASVVVGRDAALSCHISHSDGFKVKRKYCQTPVTVVEEFNSV